MECPDDSLVIPRPMLFHENDFVMPFLKKTYNMVDDPSTDAIVSWSSTHNSFIVWDLQKLSDDLLPKYFKHRNFASFTRQLNTYGFRKTDCERWEFANECFLKGQKHLLRNIKRKSNPHLQQQHQARDQQEGQHIDMNQHQQEGKQKAKQQKMEGEPKGSKSHDDLQQFELKQLKRDRDVNVIEIFNLHYSFFSSSPPAVVKKKEETSSPLMADHQTPLLLPDPEAPPPPPHHPTSTTQSRSA